ncbi:MAG: methyltransferase domain-containing protein [Gammaproteobacteria bacterium]|nr:methyltransferase domain-containing protein [Gammaproteobacteria bacterium]
MDYYTRNASDLFRQYSSLNPDDVHRGWLDLLPAQAGLACDIGAGSGRDSAWLASKGWDVIAVEPNAELRALGEQYSISAAASSSTAIGGVTWLDDALPELKQLRSLDQRFQLILISAVWMHLTPVQHERAMRIVSDLLAPGGMLVISLRLGPDAAGRFHPISADELIRLAQDRALVNKRRFRGNDLRRQEVEWDTVVFTLPDDGTGSLPLLRHIIVNDNKAASYKLGLLRVLIRIAEGAPGMVTKRSDDWVEIPFGLVGLYWLKTYMPLVLRHNLIQTPSAIHAKQSGYGWAKQDHFYSLQDLSPYDLRIGASFDANVAPRLVGAIRDACINIKLMPAHFITYPGENRQVFECETKTVKHGSAPWQITREKLQQFGTFRIPAALWQCFSQYACWLEPAIFNEWVKLMQTWNFQYDTNVYSGAFQWIDAKRDTTKVSERIQQLHNQGQHVECVWTHKRLIIANEKYAVDHCFPWSRWLNNDLWNLMPTTTSANNSKSDKLPSAGLLQHSRDYIIHWWEQAYLESDSWRQKFFIEAEAALPLMATGSTDIDSVFHAMQHQRAKLRASQQLAEWSVAIP